VQAQETTDHTDNTDGEQDSDYSSIRAIRAIRAIRGFVFATHVVHPGNTNPLERSFTAAAKAGLSV
jgi:hypothetical protein